jgi:hypothetical protein
MSYHHFHPETYEYLGTTSPRLDPEATIVSGIDVYLPPPNYATEIAPPNYTVHQIPIWNNTESTWSLIDDYRGIVYDVWGNEITWEKLGPLPEGVFLDMENITDSDRKEARIRELISYSEQLKQGNINYNGVTVNISDTEFNDFVLELTWLNTNPYERSIKGSISEINYTYDTTESYFTITGTPSSTISENYIVVLNDHIFEITRIDGNTYYTDDINRPDTTDIYVVNELHKPNIMEYIVKTEIGYNTYILHKDTANDIYNTILDYKRNIKQTTSIKLDEILLLTSSSLDDYDITAGWPNNVFAD